jgi:hypothetical protein
LSGSFVIGVYQWAQPFTWGVRITTLPGPRYSTSTGR